MGFTCHAQTGRPRDPEDGFTYVHHLRFDRSAEYDLRVPDESTTVEVTRSASIDVTSCIGKVVGGVGGDAHYEYSATTAT
eukprot:6563261-Pyramimonas_sp.AAC.1